MNTHILFRHMALCTLAVTAVTVSVSMLLTLLIFRRISKLHPTLHASIAALPYGLQKRHSIDRILADRSAASDGTLMVFVRVFQKVSLVAVWSIAATFLLIVTSIGIEVRSNR